MKPISGLRVLDLSEGIPYIGSMFADYGAELIKVERPGVGDPIRKRGAQDGHQDGPYTDYYMRGKKSLTVDYKKEKGSEVIKRLAEKVDMIVFSQTEEQLKEYGLGYEDLKEVNSKIVYGLLTPYGEDGPWKDHPDYDMLILAKTGLLEKTGHPEKPTKFGIPLGYIYASWHLTAAMLAAKLKADDTGEGMKVSVSTWQTIMQLDDTFAQVLQGLNSLPERIGNGFPTTNPTDTFKCKDGWFALSMAGDIQWANFVREAGKEDVWGEGTIYEHDPARSMKHYFGDLDQQLKDFFKTLTIDEADEICRRAVVPGGPANTIEELVDDEQVKDRNMFINHHGATQVGIPAKFVGQDSDEDILKASELGADNKELLNEIGLEDNDLEELSSEGIIK